MRLAPSASASAAAWAAIHEKMPVVMGQANVTLCLAASAARSSLMVTRRPFGTVFISSSTSTGAGMTIVPSPQRLLILPETSPTFGNPLLSTSFSRHDFFVFMPSQNSPPLQMSPYRADTQSSTPHSPSAQIHTPRNLDTSTSPIPARPAVPPTPLLLVQTSHALAHPRSPFRNSCNAAPPAQSPRHTPCILAGHHFRPKQSPSQAHRAALPEPFPASRARAPSLS